MFFVKEDGEAYTFDYMNCYLSSFGKFSEDADTVLSSPDHSHIFVLKQKAIEDSNLTGSKIDANEDTVEALVFFAKQDKQCKSLEIKIPSHSLIHCRFTYFEKIQYFITLDLANSLVVSAEVDITIDKQQRSNGYIDVYSHLFTKYPIEPCIQDGTTSMKLTIVMDLPDNFLENVPTDLQVLEQKYNDYMKDSLKRVRKATQKDIRPLLENYSVSVKTLGDILFHQNVLEFYRHKADK